MDAINKYFELDRSDLSAMRKITPTNHGIEMESYKSAYEFLKKNDLLTLFTKKKKILDIFDRLTADILMVLMGSLISSKTF